MINVANLDKRICDIKESATNTQTYREYIMQSEEELGLPRTDSLDGMPDELLLDYLEFIDYLWEK